MECPVYGRDALGVGAVLQGPAIVEQADATTVIEPGMAAQVDELGNLIIEAKSRGIAQAGFSKQER